MSDAQTAAFDLSSWLQGVVPATAVVRVYAHPTLGRELKRLREQLSSVKPDTDRGLNDAGPGTLAALIEQAEAELEATGTDFKLQGRSSTRLAKIAEGAKAEGVTNVTEVILRQLHDQIIEPEGLTLDDLRMLNEQLEPQVVRLLHTARDLNTEPPVDAPFSPGSSAARSTRTS